VAGERRPALTVPGRRDRRLSEALRLSVPGEVPPRPGGLLGLELEFSVRSGRGGPVHFGSLIHRLKLDGTALDPGDPNAYRCSWGGVITSDGAEAEIATPPVRTRPGFTARLQGWARSGEAELRRAVPRGTGLDGYSAHVSAAMPARLNDRVCRLYAQTFAADLMLLMNRIDSPGLLVRPRPGRTELCGEFTEREPLAAAAAFVAGSTKACAAAVRRQSGRTALPPRLDVRLAPAVHRYGWYVDRAAFGTDLHAAGRRALLPRASGGTIRAQSHLELAWLAAREALADDAGASDLCAADAMVAGSLPLPAEQSRPDDAPGSWRDGGVPFPAEGAVVPDTSSLRMHSRPGYTLHPVAATWDFTVFETIGPARSAYACIPRDSLPAFAAALEEGALDETIAAYLATDTRRRMLSASRQTTRPGLYDRMGDPAQLLAPERDPQTGRRDSGGHGTKQALVRTGKRNSRQQQEQAAPTKAHRFIVRAAAIAAAAVVVVAAAGVARALLSRDYSGPNGKPAGVSVQPTALAFPAVQVNATNIKSVTLTNNGKQLQMITRIRISGPGRHDFSVRTPAFLAAARRGDQAVHPAAQPLPCHRRVPHAQTCTITVAFTPLTPGSHTAELRIYLTSSRQPQDISLTGTGYRDTNTPTTTTTVASSANPSQAGQSVTYTATVSPVPDGGTVAFRDGGTAISGCSAQLVDISAGTATCQQAYPSTGSHSITAAYSGDTAYRTSTSTRLTQTVSQATTTTTVASSANPSDIGQSVTYTATVSPVPDGGTVAFSDGGTAISGCSAQLVDISAGTATCEQTYPSTGSHSITAAYSGDTSYGASATSTTLTQTVSQATTTTTVASSANPSVIGQTVTYTATVSPVPDGGTVAFSDGGIAISGCSERPVDISAGTATCQRSYKETGNYSITAAYSGDTAYATSTSSQMIQTVNTPPVVPPK
jgi:hypothetical protein